jgi:hypothetical protein
LESFWKKEIIAFNITCGDENNQNGFSFQMECPSNLKSLGQTEKIPVVVTILYRDIGRIIPKHIMVSDQNVTFQLINDQFQLDNTSKHYLSLDSVSFYYAGQIVTSSQLHKEIPPLGMVNVLSLNQLPIQWDLLEFNRMTKSHIDNKVVEFGLAVKYRIVDTNKEKTMFKTKMYPLSELIAAL